MTIDQFIDSLDNKYPPEVPPKLLALWYDGKNDWTQAHEVAQDIEDEEGYAIHAYLHRKEKDYGNASYWYMRANRKPVKCSLEEEWYNLAKEMITNAGSR